MALLLAQARNVPQAHAALKAGTLGALPVGGRRAARQDPRRRRPRPGRRAGRPAGAGLRDAAGRLRPLSWRRAGPADGRRAAAASTSVVAEADFVTIHLPKTPETIGLIGADLLAAGQARAADRQHRPGRDRRRGGAGRGDRRRAASAGAALDVFEQEPTTESPLFELDSVVVTPHLGASTREAQDKAGDHHRRAGAAGPGRRVRALRGQRRRGRGVRDGAALPAPGRAAGPASAPRWPGELPAVLEIEYQGGLADYDTRILTLSVLKGLFSRRPPTSRCPT